MEQNNKLNNNLLLCDCESVWIKEYEDRYNVMPSLNRDPYRCRSGRYSGRLWFNLTLDDVTQLQLN